MKDQINQARWLAVLAATGIGLYLCWLMLKPFIGVLEWAIVLVIVFHPVHRRLASKIKSRGLSALLSCILVILLAVLPLTLLTIAVARELAHVVPTLPTQISQFMNTQTPLFARISDWLQTVSGSTHCGRKSFCLLLRSWWHQCFRTVGHRTRPCRSCHYTWTVANLPASNRRTRDCGVRKISHSPGAVFRTHPQTRLEFTVFCQAHTVPFRTAG